MAHGASAFSRQRESTFFAGGDTRATTSFLRRRCGLNNSSLFYSWRVMVKAGGWLGLPRHYPAHVSNLDQT